ncbi:peptidoglycan DD-metalloendopeptidase family protein [Balneolales bacterium ANBcel1]|nr:peptidoglycan DD-metalloendopeptidase family protein [Balneolales bacterium ANBcel1]
MSRSQILISLLLLSLLLAAPPALHGQNYQNLRMQLEEQQEKARADIQSLRRQIIGFQDQISSAEDEYTRNYEQFQNLQREISLRNAVIRTMEQERASILEELRLTQNQIDDLNRDLQTLIDNYKSTLTYIYKHGRIPEEVLLLTSASLNQMLVRSYYLNRFEDHRQKQAQQIYDMQEELETRERELEDARSRNRQNIAETEEERQRLELRKEEQQRQIARLQRDRERLEQRLSATRNEAENMESTLSELIEEEARIRQAEQERLRRLEQERMRRLANAENIRSRREREAQIDRFSRPVEPADRPTDEQLRAIENSFEEQKGRLPWPVASGVVSARFGNRVNPVYGTSINNPGIEILTDARSEVRSVHDGYVFAVQPIPGFGNCIFVKHGRYITVYGNLTEILVERNAFVEEGDVIGASGDENSLKGPSLFFMIREQSTNLDPETWFSSR